MFSNFGLILMVNHACNLRCTYCYTGSKFQRCMTSKVAKRAIDRALTSLENNGILELGFFGGEPLLEAELILELLDYSKECSLEKNITVISNMTTNATLVNDVAWKVMMHPSLHLAVSFDGLPKVHDNCRVTIDGEGTSSIVLDTMQKLLVANKEFRVVMVVRPDNLAFIAQGIQYLRKKDIHRVDFSLDLWATWTKKDSMALENMILECAQVWKDGLPKCGINWFDEKVIKCAQVPINKTARCGFGNGEIAISPAGNLYPCERLIGEDAENNVTRLSGHVMDNQLDFIVCHPKEKNCHDECNKCQMQHLCNTSCQCSNYIRTGNADSPDLLLCKLNQLCTNEILKILQ